jgi:hypothetical protein
METSLNDMDRLGDRFMSYFTDEKDTQNARHFPILTT